MSGKRKRSRYRPENFGDGEQFADALYHGGAMPEDIERGYFGTGPNAETMKAVWTSNYAEAAEIEAREKPKRPHVFETKWEDRRRGAAPKPATNRRLNPFHPERGEEDGEK